MTVAILHLGRTAAGPLLTLELARALLAAGEEVCIVYSADAEIAADLASLPCPRLAVRTFTDATSALVGTVRLPSIGRQIDRFLVEHRVKTVVITMEQIWQALLAPIFRRRKRRVLLFVHDASPHPGEDGVLQRVLLRRQRKNADGAMVLSQHVESELTAQSTFGTKIWRTVHPAFDAPMSHPRVLPSDRIVLGFFGRMSKYKGLHLAVEAVTVLRQRGHEVELRIVGRGIPRDIPGINAPSNVLDDRWIPQEGIIEALENFTILLLPYTEASQSGVLAYATALGIPSVVTPVGGLIEQAEDIGGSEIAAAVDAIAVANSVERLLTSPGLYAERSTNATAAASERYSWGRTARDVQAAVRELQQG